MNHDEHSLSRCTLRFGRRFSGFHAGSVARVGELGARARVRTRQSCKKRREIADVEGVIPLPGAMELLQALPMQRWAIVTSCTRPLAGVRIGAAGLPKPKHLVTSSDVRRGKPDPEPYLKGAQLLGVPPSECVVIEDAPAGIRAGKAAGARVLALRTTASDAELQQAGADWIVNDCADLFLGSSAASKEFLLISIRTK